MNGSAALEHLDLELPVQPDGSVHPQGRCRRLVSSGFRPMRIFDGDLKK